MKRYPPSRNSPPYARTSRLLLYYYFRENNSLRDLRVLCAIIVICVYLTPNAASYHISAQACLCVVQAFLHKRMCMCGTHVSALAYVCKIWSRMCKNEISREKRNGTSHIYYPRAIVCCSHVFLWNKCIRKYPVYCRVLVYSRMSHVYTRMLLVHTRILLLCTRMLLVCTRMLLLHRISTRF